MLHKTHITILFALIGLLFSCEERDRVVRLLDHADSIMIEHPDSVLYLLNGLKAEKNGFHRSDLMRYELLYADAQNKAYVDFTSDSIMKQVADYYDSHGTANEKMRAYYLLGCVYRDLHEAPMTLQCFQTAVEKADTASSDCDFYTMAAIYGQMAELYHDQLLAREELAAYDMVSWCSAKCGDKYTEIRGIELKIGGYMLLCDTAAMFNTIYTVHDLYKKNNMPKAAAASYVGLVRLYTVMGEYERADSVMRVFETESGLFDEHGNIERGREHYYCDKGFFYHKTGNIPLAMKYYRKGIAKGNFLIALQGMRDIYAEQRNADSVVYYNNRYMKELGMLEGRRQTQTIQQMNSMYDYSRNQKLAAGKALEAKQNKSIALGLALLLMFFVFVAFYVYNKKEKRSMLELSHLNHKFLLSVSNYDKVQKRLSSLGSEYSTYRQETEKEINTLRDEISEYEKQYAALHDAEKEKAVMQSPVVGAMREKLSPRCSDKPLTDDDWQELMLLVEQCMPSFYVKITEGNVLSQDELRLAILTRLKFTPSDIVIIMEKSQARVSNLRQIVNKKLFSEDSSRTLNNNIMQI